MIGSCTRTTLGTFARVNVSGTPCPRCGAELSPGTSAAGLCPSCLLGAALTDGENDSLTSATTLSVGTEVGPFRILGVLGKGGMATVYRAEDARLERIVALKVLPPEFLHDETFARRFQQEARVVAKLEHPNIVPIYASGIDDGVPWMSMRLFGGGNLGMLLEHRRPHPSEVVRILRSVADALDYAHARGVVHRDIKPTNILLDEADHVCLGDFGLARMVQGERGVTRTGTLFGTPHYMAPEQALGDPLDHRCDIYSLGIVAYEMLVGAPPFTGDSPMAVLLKQVNDPLPRPANTELPPALLTAIEKGVAKAPADRWSSGGAFVSALESAMGFSRAGTAAAVTHRRSSYPVWSSHRWRAPAIAGVAIVSVLMLWATRERGADEQTPPVRPLQAPAAPAQTSTSAAGQGELVKPPPPVSTESETQARRQPDGKPSVPAGRQGPEDIPTARSPLAVPLPPAPAAEPSRTEADITASPEVTTNAPSPHPAADTLTPPIRLRASNPDYPAAARAAQIEGDVVLEAVVDANGQVRDITVSRSVHPLVDEAAKNAVSKYEYAPARRNGIPEPARVRIVVSFKLR